MIVRCFDSKRTTPVDPADFFAHNRSHGAAVADFDRDGDLDIVVGHSRFRCDANAPDDCYETAQVRFFENVFGQDAHWLQLDLEGSGGSNAAAIGARVRVETETGVQAQQVDGGHGHFGAHRDMTLHFGLGDACAADVEIRWPDAEGTTEHYRLRAGVRYRVLQGEAPQAL